MDLVDLFLKLLSGVCWTVVYIEAIRIGLRRRTYAIPFVALSMNLVWEWLYGLGGLIEWERYGTSIHIQTVVNIVWGLLDIVILLLFVQVARRHASIRISFLYFGVVVALLLSLIYQAGFLLQFGPEIGARYSAFLQNAVMSLLFITMLYRRGSTEGQSLSIALAKLVGTLAPTVTAGILGGINWLILAAGILCLLGDSYYLWALKATRRLGHPPGVRADLSAVRHG